jgi:catechol 2,3-dioxygenase-like lactoylglutathione lyase family enzyme
MNLTKPTTQEDAPMSPIRTDHVGITVRDLDTVTAFFAGLGFETEVDGSGGRVPGHRHWHT